MIAGLSRISRKSVLGQAMLLVAVLLLVNGCDSAGIKLQSVAIERVPDAPLLKRLDIQAPWLDEIRVDQRESFTRFGTDFKPRRQAQLETDGSGT